MFDSSILYPDQRSGVSTCEPDSRVTDPVQVPTYRVVHAWLGADASGQLMLVGAEALPVSPAASCLLRPLPGDRVRAVADQGRWYVTDILSRPEAHVAFQLDIGDRELAIAAARFSLRTTAIDVRAESSIREVTVADVTRAGHIVQQATGTLVMRGKSAALTADGLLRVDGAQVHMG